MVKREASPESKERVASSLSNIRRHSNEGNANNSNNKQSDKKKPCQVHRLTRGIPMLQLTLAIVLDILQIIKSERIKSRVENNAVTDVPYEAAIASAGALLAGVSGLLASYLVLCRWPRVLYAVTSCVALACSFFCVVKTVTIYSSKMLPDLVALHWAVIMFSIFLSLYNVCAIYNGCLFIFAYTKGSEKPDSGKKESGPNHGVLKKQHSAVSNVSDSSVIKVSIKHNGKSNNLQSSVEHRPSTDVSMENTRLLINDGSDHASGPDTSYTLDNKIEIQEPPSNCDQVTSEKRFDNDSDVTVTGDLSKSSSSYVVSNSKLLARTDSEMFQELDNLGRAPLCRTESGFHKVSVSSSSEFFTASNSFTNQTTSSVSEISKLSPSDDSRDSHESNDSMTTMNVIYENEKIITRSITCGSMNDVFPHENIPQINGHSTVTTPCNSTTSSVTSTPKLHHRPQVNFYAVDWDAEDGTRSDLWTVLERIMGTHGSQESITSAMSVDRSIKYDESNKIVFANLKILINNLKKRGEDFHESVTGLENRITAIEKNEKYVDNELGPLLALVQFHESLNRVSQSILDLSGIGQPDADV